jgi:hypothetical protein
MSFALYHLHQQKDAELSMEQIDLSLSMVLLPGRIESIATRRTGENSHID